MTLLVSIAVAVLFGVAAYLLLKRDLIRVITGMVLLGNAANLFIMSAGLREGGAPLIGADGEFSDPLVQALTLTAIVISFGTATLVLSLVYRVYDSHQSVDLNRIGDAEEIQASMDDQPQPGELSALDEIADEEQAEVTV